MHEVTERDLRLARNVARGDAEAESEACLALVRAAEVFDGRGDWQGFVLQRMGWAVADLRRTRARRAVLAPCGPLEGVRGGVAVPDLDMLPDEVVEALEALPDDQRDALLAGDLDRRRGPVRDGLSALRGVLGVRAA